MRIEQVTRIEAPPAPCFDLVRSLDLHVRSLARTGERAVAGRTSRMIGAGEQVTWRARHFGIVLEHEARITAFAPPVHFRDTPVRGRFAAFEHDHWFPAVTGGTVMRDVVTFRSPGGWIGRLVDRWLLRGHLARLLAARSEVVRAEAAARSPVAAPI